MIEEKTTMRLYMVPGACSQAVHIALRETGLPFEMEKVDLQAKTTADGGDYLAINPKGQVPALKLDDEAVLTEVQVILQYLADRAASAGLLPAAGTMPRYRVLEWANFVSGEIHKTFGPLFRPTTPEDFKPVVRDAVLAKLAIADKRLGESPYLAGDSLSIADIYLFVVARWTGWVGIDRSHLVNLQAFLDRLAARPAFAEALKAEGF